MFLVNCARGGIINETDIVAAVQSGKVGGCALDVYETEPCPEDSPLRTEPNIVMTPHLGASTKEAQESVGSKSPKRLLIFVNGAVRNAVNMPSLDAKAYEAVKPYLDLGEKLGKLVAQLGSQRNKQLKITYGGKQPKFRLIR